MDITQNTGFSTHSPAKPRRVKTPKLSRARFTAQALGLSVPPIRAAWGAEGCVNRRPAIAAFVWDEEIQIRDGQRFVLLDHLDRRLVLGEREKYGRRQRHLHLRSLREGYDGYAIVCKRKPGQPDSWDLQSFIPHLFPMGSLVEHDRKIWASIKDF